MKKILILLITAFAMISCTEDDANPVIPATNKVYSPKKITVIAGDYGTKIYNFTHDTKGNVLTSVCDSVSRETNTYDSRSNQLTKVTEKFINNNWSTFDSTICTYDQKDNMMSDIYKENNGRFSKSVYIYDANNNIVSITNQNNYSGTLQYSYRWSYTYNSSNKMIFHLFESFENNTWKDNIKETYTYNEQGKLSTTLTEIKNNSIWENDCFETINYNSSGDVSSQLTRNWVNGSWVNEYRFNPSYDSNHYLTSFFTEVFNNNVWENSFKRNFKYDTNYMTTEMENFGYSSNSWVPAYNWLGLYNNKKQFYWYSGMGFKMTVEYTAFETDAKSIKSKTPNQTPEIMHNEMTDRLKNFKRFDK